LLLCCFFVFFSCRRRKQKDAGGDRDEETPVKKHKKYSHYTQYDEETQQYQTQETYEEPMKTDLIPHESDDCSSSGEENLPISSSNFQNLLSNHIRNLADESIRDPNTQFARLYRQAQNNKIKKKIRHILQRTDLKKEKKVDLIGALLITLQNG
jgi:hypothetical protein